MVKVNGEPFDGAGMTIAQVLVQHGFDSTRIAVEQNGQLVPKAKYPETVLRDGDALEVVSFVGGG